MNTNVTCYCRIPLWTRSARRATRSNTCITMSESSNGTSARWWCFSRHLTTTMSETFRRTRRVLITESYLLISRGLLLLGSVSNWVLSRRESRMRLAVGAPQTQLNSSLASFLSVAKLWRFSDYQRLSWVEMSRYELVRKQFFAIITIIVYFAEAAIHI